MHVTTVLVRLFLVFSLFALTAAPVAAQTEPPAPLERGLQRQAPIRQPTPLAEGADATVTSTVIQIPAIADTYIASERPNENFGGDALFLGFNFFGDRFGAQRILVRFNLDSIPDDARINSARLRLRLSFASPDDDSPMRTVLRRLASDWDEFDVTWNREPQWAAVRDSTFVGTNQDWYEWEIPDLVQGWVDGTFANHGLELIGDERVQQSERVFYARETSTDFFPQLIVDYDVISDDSPPNVDVDPLPAFVPRSFAVSWSGDDVGSAGIDYYDVQYRVDGGEWIDWLEGTTDTAEEFMDGQNGRIYEFRARGVDEVGNVEPFGDAEAITVVDNGAPISLIEPLPNMLNRQSFSVNWTGNDSGGSGIQYYDVRYRLDGSPWQLWLSETTTTSALFNALQEGVYEFEVRAVDGAGRAEPFTGQSEATVIVDAEAPFLAPQVFLPLGYGP